MNYTPVSSRSAEDLAAGVAATSARQREATDSFNANRTAAKTAGMPNYARESQFQQGYKLGNTTTAQPTTPTILTDTNIRDKKIPQLQQDATSTITKYDQNKSQLDQTTQIKADKKVEQDTKKAAADPLAGAFSEDDTDYIDPVSQKQLDILDRLSKSQDSSTRLLADRQREMADQKRAQQTQIAAQSQGAAQTGMRRLGSRYTPGAFGQVRGQLQQDNYEKLAQIDDEENSAVEELRLAQDNKDFELVGKKLDVLKDVRDARIKALEDAKKAQADIDKENKKDISTVLQDAAKNGAPADVLNAISGSEDVAAATVAAAEYLQTGEYADYKRAVQDAGGTPVDPNTYYARKIYGDSGAPGTGLDGDVPFAATIDGASSLAPSDAARKASAAQLSSLAKNGDYPALLNRMEGLAKNGMSGTFKTDVENAQSQIGALDNMSKVLKEYQAAGGDMNLLKGTEQEIGNKIGQLSTDPKFASLAAQMKAAYFQYRNDMSGAAFGASENASYQSIYPSADKSFELNAAVMDGLKNYYTQKVDTAYTDQLGEGYTNLKDYVDKGLTPTGAYLLKTETDAKNKVIQLGQQDPQVQQAVSGFIGENPNASAYDVLQFLGVPVATSKEVSMSDPSNGVVGGYDIKSYATDPNHEKRVAAIYKNTKDLTDASSVDSYIKRIAPNSPITGAQVMKASIANNVTPGIILAIMEQDSTFGTQGKAVRTKNPGNVGNTDSGATQSYGDWEKGVLAVAQNLAKRKIS